MRKVVFLDIDGVLRDTSGPAVINPTLAALLHNFLEDQDAHVAISSTWRLAYDLSFFRREISDRVRWLLPTSEKADRLDRINRGKLIRHIADRNFQGAAWAALDDDPELFPAEEDRRRCVFVDKQALLTESDLCALGEMLNSVR